MGALPGPDPLPISQNTALFSLIGTYFGGDGVNTFNLPDLRGRVAVSQGQGTGLSNYNQGQTGGAESVSLAASQAPAHTHTLMAASNVTTPNPGPSLALGSPATAVQLYGTNSPTALASGSIGTFGSGSRSRKQTALSRAQLHYRFGGHLPVAKLIQRLFDGPVSRTDQHFRL